MDVDLLQDELVRVQREKPETESPFPPRFEAATPAEPKPLATAVCSICQERPANRQCLHCNQHVCAHDTWVMLGLCKTCVTRQEMDEARQPRTTRPDLDIKWIED